MPRKSGFSFRSRPKRGNRAVLNDHSESESSDSSGNFVKTPEKETKIFSKNKVELIIDKRLVYLVKWVGYPKSYDSWEPVENLYSCLKMIENFEAGREMTPEQLPDNASTLSEDEYMVEKILSKQFEYLVKFQGLPYSDNEWFIAESLKKYSPMIRAFEELQEVAEDSPICPENLLHIGWIPYKIHGAVHEDWFVMEWQWHGQKKVSLIPRLEAKIKHPQIVIAYYESCVGFA